MVRIRTQSLPSVFQLRGEMDRLMSSLWGERPPESFGLPGAFPAINLWETESGYVAEAELPGVTADSLDISVLGRDVTIKGTRHEFAADDPTQAKWIARERRVGDFERKIHLPTEIDAEQIDANLVDGVLGLTLPKAAAALPRQIKVGESPS